MLHPRGELRHPQHDREGDGADDGDLGRIEDGRRDDATELADLLRSQDPALREPLARQRALRDRIQTVLQRKRSGHAFTSAGCGGPAKHMVAIGG